MGKCQHLEISAESLSLNWLGPQTATGLVIKDPIKDLQFTASELSCASPLLRLLVGRDRFASIQIKQATLALQSSDVQPVRFTDMQLLMHWPSELTLTGKVGDGYFAVQVTNPPSSPQAEARFSHFPTSAIDRLCSFYAPTARGLLPSLIGPTANLDLTLHTIDNQQVCTIHATSEYFSADLQVRKKGNEFILQTPAQVQFQFTPQLLHVLNIPMELTAPIPATLEITSLHIPFDVMQGTITIDALPLHNRDLAALLGDRVHASFSYHAPILTLTANTPTLSLEESSFEIGEKIVLQDPVQIHATSLCNSWVQLPSSTIFSIEEFSFPHFAMKGGAVISEMLFRGLPVNESILILDVQKDQISIDLQSEILSASLTGTLHKDLSFEVFSPSFTLDQTVVRDCYLRATYACEKEQLFAKLSAYSTLEEQQGKFHLSLEKNPSQLSVTTEIDQFPSAFFDIFAANSPYSSSALFGPLVTANATCTIKEQSGPITLRLHSSNARVSVNGLLQKGLLSLKEPLHLQLSCTPSITSLLFNDDPSFVLVSQDPLTLEIAPEGTLIPLFPFDLSLLNMQKARLELGQITCSGTDRLNLALSLLNQELDQNLHLWFTPVDLCVVNGVLQVDRTEILVNQLLEVCLWGTANLPKDHMRMTLGVPANTLKKTLGVKELPSDYVLQLPLRGKISNVQFDFGKAGKKVSSLLLWQKNAITQSLETNLPGIIAGELAKKILPLPNKDKKAPTPKRPFPWEKKKSKKPEGEKPLKFAKEEPFPILKFF